MVFLFNTTQFPSNYSNNNVEHKAHNILKYINNFIITYQKTMQLLAIPLSALMNRHLQDYLTDWIRIKISQTRVFYGAVIVSSEESITESVKQTLKERVANPLWGYIILSWVGFNWKSIAIMCLSEASVVTRIQQITSTEDFYLKTLCYPVVLGFILATFFPYISNLVTLLQVKATAWRVRQKVEAENLEESARLASKLKIEAQKNKIEEEVLKIEVLKKEREQLQNDITDSNARADAARLLTEDAVKEYWRWVDKTAELLITLDNFNKLGNGMSMNQFKESVKNIIADDALDAALKNVRDKQSQMNKVKSNPTYSDTFRR
ncbi:TPA: hypothetical protein JTK63_004521 [Escherichia coli]|nr:hypothetical protein [Escherichia coli]